MNIRIRFGHHPQPNPLKRRPCKNTKIRTGYPINSCKKSISKPPTRSNIFKRFIKW